ncbi:MAG: hypothetical protein EBZ77_12980 [Chitinophagia bacterium]|nr:hypothetical protein [Chitinophagia bacterium]
MATTFRSPFDGLPEPLITIWEPAAKVALERFAANGYKCPRKVLLNSPVTILEPRHPETISNINTPADAATLADKFPLLQLNGQ